MKRVKIRYTNGKRKTFTGDTIELDPKTKEIRVLNKGQDIRVVKVGRDIQQARVYQVKEGNNG